MQAVWLVDEPQRNVGTTDVRSDITRFLYSPGLNVVRNDDQGRFFVDTASVDFIGCLGWWDLLRSLVREESNGGGIPVPVQRLMSKIHASNGIVAGLAGHG